MFAICCMTVRLLLYTAISEAASRNWPYQKLPPSRATVKILWVAGEYEGDDKRHNGPSGSGRPPIFDTSIVGQSKLLRLPKNRVSVVEAAWKERHFFLLRDLISDGVANVSNPLHAYSFAFVAKRIGLRIFVINVLVANQCYSYWLYWGPIYNTNIQRPRLPRPLVPHSILSIKIKIVRELCCMTIVLNFIPIV